MARIDCDNGKQSWAAAGDGFGSNHLISMGQQMAILARHWNILPVLGLPSAPGKDELLRVLAEPSVATIEEGEGEGEEGEEDADPEEYYSAESDTDEEEVEEEERGSNKRSRR